MFLIMPFQNLLVLFAEDVWDVGATGLGTLGAVAGTGGLVGAVLVAWRSSAARRLGVMMSAVLGFGVFLVAFAPSPSFLLALPLPFPLPSPLLSSSRSTGSTATSGSRSAELNWPWRRMKTAG